MASLDSNRGQPIYTSSGIDMSLLSGRHDIGFIPVPLTHNVDVSLPNMSGYPIHTNVTTSGNTLNTTEPRPKPQIMILEKMKQLRDEGKYCDLFIDVKGMRFIAHKSLVAAWSPYFDEALTNTNYAEKDLLIINYDSYEVFSDLLDFFYTGNILPRETNFLQLLHLAVSFDIDLLKSYCEEFLRCNLHLGNCLSTYFLSRKYSLESLEDFVSGFIQANLADMVKQSEFLQMKAERFHALLSKGSMLTLKPEIKLFLVISWVGFEVQGREKYLVVLLKHIDWSDVASDFLLEISRTENFFTTHESSLYLLLQTLFSSGISLGPYKESFSSLRLTYSHLLSEVVHSGLILPESDEFIAVTAIGATTRTIKHDASINTVTDWEVYDPDKELQHKSIVSNSSDSVQPEQNSNENNLNESSGIFEDINEESSFVEDHEDAAVQEEKTIEEVESKVKIMPKKSKKGKGKKKTNKLMSKNNVFITKKLIKQEENHNDTNNITPQNDEQGLQNDDEISHKGENSDKKEDNQDGDDDEEDDDPDYDEDEDEVVSKTKMKTKRKRNVVKYHCPHCKYTSDVESRLNKHVKWNHENNVILTCTICHAFETNSNRSYNHHMKTHFPSPPFNCEASGCDYTTEKFPSLLIHRMKHAEQRPFPCDECGSRFRTRNNLYAHMKTHTGLRPWKCPHCPKTFALKNTMDQHLVTHDDLRPYLCDLCGFATKYQSHLTAHKRTHTGDMFKCDHPNCNYATPKRSQLKCHIRTHLGIRSYTCAECGKTFIEKSHLKRHESIHLTVKPFKCTLCDYSTARKDKLKYHLSKSHETNGDKKNKGRPTKQRKKPAPKQESIVLPEAIYVHSIPKNFDHGGYTIQGISTDGTNTISLDDLRRAQFSGEGITIQVPVSMDQLVIPMEDTKSTSPRPLPATSPITPVTLIPEDHQMYIQNVMTQVPMSSVQQQQQQQHHPDQQQQHHPDQQQHQHPEPQQGTVQNQEYGGLGAFMALF